MSKVYEKIGLVQAALAKTGISKDKRNSQQGYNFRGIDDVYEALAPLLAANGLCILPRILSREVVERTTAKGGAIFNVTVEAEFDFVASEDGSNHVVRTFGEAMDTADKATNKAMSAAYKYAALMTFAIPTEGDNDADATTHEVAPVKEKPTGPITDVTRDWLSAQIEASPRSLAAMVKEFGISSPKDLEYENIPAVLKWLKTQEPSTAEYLDDDIPGFD